MQTSAQTTVPAPGLPDPSPQTMSMPTMGVPVARPDADEVTIGVAVQVPEPWASQLQQCRADFGDSTAVAIPTHITLLPPTVVPRSQIEDIAVHLARVAAGLPSFELAIDGTGTFRPVSPVVFVQVVAGADGCDRLQKLVRTGPLQRSLSFPYHPHVTVAHHLPDDALDRALTSLKDFHCSFSVRGFGLYEHGQDGVWRQRRRFPFGGGQA
ncbi:MAG TPA: 2'-5' RNA ligase family protein [Kineosporiaceae bacterium]|nr:2'-5' RNA ligase family protein [Kineosporiaceae bacterium]